jgi:hypothetical protein
MHKFYIYFFIVIFQIMQPEALQFFKKYCL